MSKWKNKTRSGHPVRIYAEDCWNNEIHGSVNVGGGWRLCAWDKNGEALEHMGPPGSSLIPNAPTIDWPAQPAWCKAVAMVKGGSWIRFDGVPIASVTLWLSSEGRSLFTQQMHPSESPQWDGDWKDSLCIRPEGGQ